MTRSARRWLVLVMSDTYPRALPAHPSAELIRWQTRLRRWTALLVLGTAVALGLILEASILLVRRIGAVHEEPPIAPSEAMPGTISETQTSAGPPVKPEQETPKPAPTVPPDRLLEVLGDLTVTQLYQSQLNLGLLADAMENATYPESQTRKYLDSVMELVERVDNELARLDDDRLPTENRKRLAAARRTIALMRTEASELRAYWQTGDKEQAEAYHKARKEAATVLNDLLDVPK